LEIITREKDQPFAEILVTVTLRLLFVVCFAVNRNLSLYSRLLAGAYGTIPWLFSTQRRKGHKVRKEKKKGVSYAGLS